MSDPRHLENGGSEAIRSEIRETRRRMDETCDRLAERLQPRHLVNDLLYLWQSRHGPGELREKAETMKNQLMETSQRVGNAMIDHAKENPVPLLLVGAGLAWWIIDQSRSHGQQGEEEVGEFEDYGGMEPAYGTSVGYASESGEEPSRAEEATSAAREKLAQAREGLRRRGRRIRERASHYGHELESKAEEWGRRTRERLDRGYERGREELVRTVDRHPLATGVACLAMGAIASFLLPQTERENAWIGATADDLRRRAKERGEDLLERGKHVVQATVDSAKKEAEAQGLTPQKVGEDAEEVGREAASAARRTAQKEGLVEPNPPATGGGSPASPATGS